MEMIDEPLYITLIKAIFASIVTGISLKIVKIIFSYDTTNLF